WPAVRGDYVPRSAAILALLLMIVPAAARQAFAQGTDDERPRVEVGGLLFYDYTFAVTPTTTDAAGAPVHANGFNVTRTYLDVTARLSSLLRVRITPDIAGTSSDGLTFRLKYGYAQFDLAPFTGAWSGTWVRAGIQPTPFLAGADDVYRYRFQGT